MVYCGGFHTLSKGVFMKEEIELFRSANARLNQVIRESERLHAIAKQQKEGFKPENMPEMRRLASSITQCVHEFNAYHNALTT